MIRSIFALCVFLHYVENHSRLNDFRGSEKQWKADFSSPSSSFSVDSRTQKSIITKKCKGPIAALKIVCKGCYNDMGLSRRSIWGEVFQQRPVRAEGFVDRCCLRSSSCGLTQMRKYCSDSCPWLSTHNRRS